MTRRTTLLADAHRREELARGRPLTRDEAGAVDATYFADAMRELSRELGEERGDDERAD